MNLQELKEWGDVARPAFHIFLIWILAWGVLRFIRRLLPVLQRQITHRAAGSPDFKRLETLMSVFRYATNVVLIGLAVLVTLSEVGISITPILATAGVAGIAVGFGAQSLVKDFFNGLFLLIENQVDEGDMIEAAGKSGIVERVTLRHIRMRDYDGSVHYIPNGMITIVTNKSREFAYSIIDINVPRDKSLEQVFVLMRTVSDEMRHDTSLGPSIVDDINIAGVERIEDANTVVRCRMKVLPAKQWRVRREFLFRIKQKMDALREATPTVQAG